MERLSGASQLAPRADDASSERADATEPTFSRCLLGMLYSVSSTARANYLDIQCYEHLPTFRHT